MNQNYSIKDILREGKASHVIMVILLFAFANDGFDYINWGFKKFYVDHILAFLFLVLWIISKKSNQNLNFKNYVLAFAFIPFLSFYNAQNLYGQPLFKSVMAVSPSLIWLFYFLLPHWKIKESSILKAFLFIALFIVGVQIIQQFTFPDVAFGVKTPDEIEAGQEIAEKRSGLWRFTIGNNAFYTAVILFALWTGVKWKIRNVSVLIIGILLISVYLTLTRQVLFSMVLTLLLSFFVGKDSINVRALVVGGILFILLFKFSNLLFGDLIKMVGEDARKDYVRVLAANFFWNETFQSIPTIYFGHGVARSDSFLQVQEKFQEVYHYYTTDVGFIGIMWHYGIIYVIACYDLLYSLFVKWREVIPTYIRLFVLFTGMMSVMIFPMNNPVSYLTWCFLLYICDTYINKGRPIVSKL